MGACFYGSKGVLGRCVSYCIDNVVVAAWR